MNIESTSAGRPSEAGPEKKRLSVFNKLGCGDNCRIIHFVFGGLGMLLLLRNFGFKEWPCLLLGIAFEFSGIFVMHFGHPFLQACFLYYPFLWLVWDMAFLQRKRWCFVAAPWLVA